MLTEKVGYSAVQWSRWKQFESWNLLDPASFAFTYTDTDKKHDLDPTAANAGAGYLAQPGEAHFLQECSGKGICDRDSGLCSCFDGFTGAACQRGTFVAPHSALLTGCNQCIQATAATRQRVVTQLAWHGPSA